MTKFNHTQARQSYINTVFLVVKPIIDKFDPEVLLKVGAPADEYDPESYKLAEVITRELIQTEEELFNVLALVFHMMFQEWGTKVCYYPYFKPIAAEIFAKLKEHNLIRSSQLGETCLTQTDAVPR